MRFLITFFMVLICSQFGFTAEALLSKIERTDADPSAMPGYMYDFDQVFQFKSGTLKGKAVFFALNDPGQAKEDQIPRFVISDGKAIVDKVDLPTIEAGWNIVTVQAVSAQRTSSGVRILAVLTLEPMSGRSSDYWDQCFVFDISSTGKIEKNEALNSKLAKTKPRVKTIKGLLSYIKKNSL